MALGIIFRFYCYYLAVLHPLLFSSAAGYYAVPLILF